MKVIRGDFEKKNRPGIPGNFVERLLVVCLLKIINTADRNNTLEAIIIASDNTCSVAIITKGKCGPNRGEGNDIFLRECSHDISNHLRGCHLSRAGLFDLGMSKVKETTICLSHRNNLGRYWQPPRMYSLFRETAQLGSRQFQHFRTCSFQGFFSVPKFKMSTFACRSPVKNARALLV